MRKLLFIFSIFLLTSCSLEFLPPAQDIEATSGVCVFEAKNGFERFYDAGATRSVRDYYTSGSIVLNGSYFGMAPWQDGKWRGTGMNIPAGLWIQDGKEVSTLRTDDPNLSHVVMGDFALNSISILGNQEFQKYQSSASSVGTSFLREVGVFQTGPLVLSGNVLQSFSGSWHANEPHERTLLGKTQSGKVYFFVFTIPKTLTEVANIVVQDDRFTLDPITLVNLDGGPSTAFYDGKSGFREDAKLPIIFLIHP